MTVDHQAAPSKDELVAAYKTILRSYIDLRPSGIRLKIAEALGKHKSFVSQITNPSYKVPLPARHVGTIFEICHFSPEERQTFLAAYRAAHPNQSRSVRENARSGSTRVLHIPVPAFDDAETQRDVEETIRQFANRVIGLALRGGDRR